jgi:hypothetical protein
LFVITHHLVSYSISLKTNHDERAWSHKQGITLSREHNIAIANLAHLEEDKIRDAKNAIADGVAYLQGVTENHSRSAGSASEQYVP